MAAFQCTGTTQAGQPCKNLTTNQDRWCRRCVSPTKGIDLKNVTIGVSNLNSLQSSERMSGIAARTLVNVAQALSDRIAPYGFQGGIDKPKVDMSYYEEQMMTPHFVRVGVWEQDVLIPHREYEVLLSYDPIISGPPYNMPVARVFLKDEPDVSPLPADDITVKAEKCSECNKKTDTYVVLLDSKGEKAICQPCYSKKTKTPKDVIENLYNTVVDSNLAFEEDVMPVGVFDGTIVRIMSYAAITNSAALEDNRSAIQYFMDYFNQSSQVNPISQSEIDTAKLIDQYAFLAEMSEFLKPNERKVFERLMSPGYLEEEFAQIVKNVEDIQKFDQMCIERAKLAIRAEAGVLKIDTKVPGDFRVLSVEEIGDSKIRTIRMVGTDGRHYEAIASQGNINLTSVRKGDVVKTSPVTINGVKNVEDEVVPVHEISLSNVKQSSRGICGSDERPHAFHETVSPFAIFSLGILQGTKIKVCVDCGEVASME